MELSHWGSGTTAFQPAMEQWSLFSESNGSGYELNPQKRIHVRPGLDKTLFMVSIGYHSCSCCHQLLIPDSHLHVKTPESHIVTWKDRSDRWIDLCRWKRAIDLPTHQSLAGVVADFLAGKFSTFIGLTTIFDRNQLIALSELT